MAQPCEVVITSDSTGQMWNCSIWNPLTDTTALHYKGGGVKGILYAFFQGNTFCQQTAISHC